MNALCFLGNCRNCLLHSSAGLAVCLLVLTATPHASADAVTNVIACDWELLRAAAATGGNYRFECDTTLVVPQTLVISNKLCLDAAGHQVTLSGGKSNRILHVLQTGEFHVRGIHFNDGFADRGGAIRNQGGKLYLDSVVFERNRAKPSFANRVEGLGGAVDNSGGYVHASKSHWIGNEVRGSDGTVVSGPFTFRFLATAARGGAIYNDSGIVELEDCQFLTNLAQGGTGMSQTPQHRGADGFGGAIENAGRLTLLRTTFSSNQARGGEGVLIGDIAYSGNGQASGGAIANHGTLFATNCTWHFNGVESRQITLPQGPFGEGNAGPHRGGALYSDSPSNTVILVHTTFSENVAAPSYFQQTGLGGAIFDLNSSVLISRSIFAHGLLSSNFAGVVIDGGYNLSSDLSAALTAEGSRAGIDPHLGILNDNQGPTLTVGLLADSPAIDAIPGVPLVAEDQRGGSRPHGVATDIGAYESGALSLPFRMTLLPFAGIPGTRTILVRGEAGKVIQLLVSNTLNGPWSQVSEIKADPEGVATFEINLEGPQHFFRASQ